MLPVLTRPSGRPRVNPVFDPEALPGLAARWPASGAETGGAAGFTAASSQYFAVPTSESLKPAASLTGLTIGAVVRLTTKAADQGIAGICGAAADFVGVSYYLGYESAADRFVFKASNGTTLGSVSSTGAPTVNTWYSVVGWWDGAGTLNLSVNGEASPASVAYALIPQATADDFRVGRVAGNYLDGRLEKVWVLRRPPTSLERTSLWNAGEPPRYSRAPASLRNDPLLSAWWDLSLINAGETAPDRLTRRNRYPGTLVNTPTWSAEHPAALTGHAGSVEFDGTNNRHVSHAGIPYLIDTLGQGTQGIGVMSLSLWVYRTATGAAAQLLWGTAGGTGLALNNGKLAWKIGAVYSTSPPDILSLSAWHHVVLRIAGDIRWQLWVDGALAATITPQSGYWTPDSLAVLGGTASGTTATARLCDAQFWERELTDAEIATLAAGGTVAGALRHYRLDEGTGTSAADTAGFGNDLTPTNSPVPVDGSYLELVEGGDPVRTLADASGAGQHLSPPAAAKRPSWEDDPSPIPLLGMDAALRFNYVQGHCLQRSAVLGSAVTACTVVLAGRVWDFYHTYGTWPTSPGHMHAWGASNDGLFPTSGTSSSSGLALGYRYGRPSGPNLSAGWLAYAKGAGSAPVSLVAGQQPDGFPHVLMLTYQGGGTAASRYLRLYRDGAAIGEVTGATVPATLNLGGMTELGSIGSGVAATACGWQHFDCRVYTAAHDGYAGRFAAWYDDHGLVVPESRWSSVFNGGGFDGANPAGFNIGASLDRNPVTGRLHAAWTSGVGDPCPRSAWASYSDDEGATWSPRTRIMFGEPNFQALPVDSVTYLANGDLLLHVYWLPYPATTWWETYQFRSVDDGLTWQAEGVIPPPAGYNTYMGQTCKVMHVGSELLLQFQTQLLSPTNWRSMLMAAPYPATDNEWELRVDFGVAAGGAAMTTQLIEGNVVRMDANNWLAVHRASLAPKFQWSYDGGADWAEAVSFGRNPGSIIHGLCRGHLCDDGSILIFLTRRGTLSTSPAEYRAGCAVYRSRDGGRSWGPCTQLLSDSRGFCYPSIARLGGGRIAVAMSDDQVNITLWRGHEGVFPG